MRVEGIEYEINWRKFKRGASFLIPCLDPAKARKELDIVLKRLKFKVLTKVVIEDGIQCLRIWRM
jgi:hypothetical protein